MDNINFAIKCQIIREINQSAEVINQRILLKLREDNYEILEETSSRISFTDSNYPLTSRREVSPKLDDGMFEFLNHNDVIAKVKLTYFVSYKFPLFVALCIVIISCFSDPIELVMILVIMIFFTFEFFQQRRNGDRLLDSILFMDT